MMVFVDTKYRPKKKQATKSPVYTKYNPPPFKNKTVTVSHRRVDHSHIPSMSFGVADTPKKENIKYSGDKLLGVTFMHKSNS